MTPEELQAQLETVDLINTEVTAVLGQQSDDAAKIEARAIVLVGYAGALSAFLATRHPQVVLGALAYTAYAGAAAFGIVSFMLAPGWKLQIAPRHLFTKYLERSKADTLAALAATRVEMYEANIPRLRVKSRYTLLSLSCLVVGVGLMVSSIIIVAS